MFTKRIFMIFMAVVFIGASIAAVEAKMTVKFGHVGPLTHPQHLGALAFAKHINENTKGKIVIQVFPQGQLGGERSMLEQVQSGTLHMTAITSGVLANYVPEVGIIELPFIYPSKAVAHEVLDDKDVRERLAKYCDSKGLVFIGYTENEFRDITNSNKPIRRPEDLKGLKMRVIESPIFIDTFRILGAIPVPLPFTEIHSALRQKSIDGQDNPLYTSVLMRFTEVNKFATVTHHILTECPVVVNKKFWSSLTPDQQKIFMEAAEIQIKINREGNAKGSADAIKKAQAQKVDVYILTPQDRDAFKKTVKPVLNKYRGVFGAEWFDFFMKKIEFYAR